MKKIVFIFCLIFVLFSNKSFAADTFENSGPIKGYLNLKIINLNQDKKVKKYILKYGTEEPTNTAEELPYTTIIIPNESILGEYHGIVPVELNGTALYLGVNDIYEDGSESGYTNGKFLSNYVPGTIATTITK